MLFVLLHAYFTNPPQDGGHGQSTWQIMVLGPEITFLGELMYKNPPMGAAVYMSLYDVVSWRLYP